jgi:hypothetical protein
MAFIAPNLWTTQEFKENTIPKTQQPFPQNPIFCLEPSISSPNNVFTAARIGSASMDAEVYKIKFFGINNEIITAALKIMPLLNFNSEINNNREISIATLASSLVLKGKSPYFPIVYSSGFCDNVTFFAVSNGGKFDQKAKNFAIIRYLMRKFPEVSTRISRLYKANLSIPDIIQKLTLPVSNEELTQINGQANYLVNELANQDLLYWSQMPHLIDEWRNIIRQVIEGIEDMGNLLKISHNDLHLGNILLSCGMNHKKVRY